MGIFRFFPRLEGMKEWKNKAVYTAALVAGGWAGAENLEKRLYDGRTDRPTDRKVAYRVACPRLKKVQ